MAAIEIAFASLSDATIKQYSVVFKPWFSYCQRKSCDPYNAEIKEILEFLSEKFNNGASYGTLNTARSAISLISRIDISDNDGIRRFFKGVFRLRPTNPKYTKTWDTEILLQFAARLEPIEKLSLEQITKKLMILLALGTAHRMQTLSLIRINNITINTTGVEIKIMDHIKTSRVGSIRPVFFLPRFKENLGLCVARSLEHYMKVTKEYRKEKNRLFITVKKPHKAASTQTISRWIKDCLISCNIGHTALVTRQRQRRSEEE